MKRSPIRRKASLKKVASKEDTDKNEETNKFHKIKADLKDLHNFYMEIWRQREHKSELSGKPLGKEANSTYFHHILSKRKHPDRILDAANIILLTFEEHEKVENDPLYFEEINRRRKELLENYGKS